MILLIALRVFLKCSFVCRLCTIRLSSVFYSSAIRQTNKTQTKDNNFLHEKGFVCSVDAIKNLLWRKESG
ncbi:hypothetical protein HMPREF1981_02218 [Bacteroides pyogenes F0041]|uniref:Uncharacterized protein n=1 Tax=Bacteroides pyogenes F0041 TaxID=1321819 RepID=U2DT17_9BACE|nr:hypothetical protein HMPREF1981_02218 [Bacteroides pyogenes F0041]